MDAATDLSVFVRHPAEGVSAMDLVVEGVYCGACIVTIEKGLRKQAGVRGARVNLASKRVSVEWSDGDLAPNLIIEKLDSLGYPAYPFTAATVDSIEAAEEKRLLRCLGVAAFGAMNVMLLSVALWAGASNEANASATRDLFHWFSALVAIPTVAYAGQPFFDSALRAVRLRAVNMDVPITIGVLLSLLMSVVQTLQHAEETYFESGVMLLMFLLAGRVLDQQMRRRTRDVAINLAAIKADKALKLMPNDEAIETPILAIFPGDLVLARAGDRIAVDGVVEDGRSEVDQSLVTGETAPVAVKPGTIVYAGTLNISGALRVRVAKASEGTLLDEVNELLVKAIEQRSTYVQLADRAARLYAPVVHCTAILTFLTWVILGLAWQHALVIAITVLIITCPCALGLAVPAVQVVAASAMFRRSIILNSGDALERLADIDTVVFDKTGTLTLPQPKLVNGDEIDAADLALAGALALASKHPLAKAVAEAAGVKSPLAAQEFPGQGVEAVVDGKTLRLGSAEFCGAQAEAAALAVRWPDASLIAFSGPQRKLAFVVRQALRGDAAATVERLMQAGYAVEVLSGDHFAAVAEVARALKIGEFRAKMKPADKIDRLKALRDAGKRVLMVGDGLNDAPALAAANVSMSPITAAHLTQAQADAMFMSEHLAPVADALALARRAKELMLQNLWLSVIYNAIAVPVAILGFASPLIAAAAMSGSSVIVTLNAMRARSAPGVTRLAKSNLRSVGLPADEAHDGGQQAAAPNRRQIVAELDGANR